MVEPGDPAEQAAGGHDLVTFCELGLECLDGPDPTPWNHYEQQDTRHDHEAEVRNSSHSANITDFDGGHPDQSGDQSGASLAPALPPFGAGCRAGAWSSDRHVEGLVTVGGNGGFEPLQARPAVHLDLTGVGETGQRREPFGLRERLVAHPVGLDDDVEEPGVERALRVVDARRRPSPAGSAAG